MPLQRRVPKFGFNNINRTEYKAINIEVLQALAEKRNLSEINPEVLFEAGLVAKNDLVKILGNGALTTKIDVKAHAFSKSAVAAIEAAQGTVEKL
jgi:large subunit ribosomal protein L15